ncbi:Gag-Pol polyprotein, partial [Mucuna pruriens]
MKCPSNSSYFVKSLTPFPVSNGYSYILLAVNYVSRWVEVIATKTNDAKVVIDFLISNIFYWFGVSKALINDQGSHFCNRAMSYLLNKYGVVHRVSSAYHPETNNQVENCIPDSARDESLPDHFRGQRKKAPATRTEGASLGSLWELLNLQTKSKFRSRWDGLFVITNVNEHQIKLFHEGLEPTVSEMESISLMEPSPTDSTP